MHLLSFYGTSAGGAGVVQGKIAIVSFQKLRDGGGGGHIGLNVEGALPSRLSYESLSRSLESNSKVQDGSD